MGTAGSARLLRNDDSSEDGLEDIKLNGKVFPPWNLMLKAFTNLLAGTCVVASLGSPSGRQS